MHRSVVVVALATLALIAARASVPQAAPEMNPEQKAGIEACMKALTLGAPHKLLAVSADTYDVKVKSWNGPTAPPTEIASTAVRTVDLDSRTVAERFQGSMMGMPSTGLGLQDFDNVSGKC
jgi:hypothetical protein